MQYSIEPEDQTYVRDCGFLNFAKNIDKNLDCKYSQKKFLIPLKNLQQVHLKLLQREQFKKHHKQLVI